jgi:hypothetical protein
MKTDDQPNGKALSANQGNSGTDAAAEQPPTQGLHHEDSYRATTINRRELHH